MFIETTASRPLPPALRLRESEGKKVSTGQPQQADLIAAIMSTPSPGCC